MKVTSEIEIDMSLLSQGKEFQDKENYKRNVDGSFEPVSYLPGSTIRFWLNDEPVSYDLHWHPVAELIFPLENGYTVTVGLTTYELSPGDIFLIPPGELHSLQAPSSGMRFIFMFDLSVLSNINGYFHLYSFLTQPLLINSSLCAPIYKEEAELIIQLYRDYLLNDSLRDLTIYSRLLSLLVTYAKYRIPLADYSVASSPASIDKQRRLMDKLDSIFRYINDHYAEDITLESVADVAGFSKFHFSRLFKQYTGNNFYDYLCHRRIKSAEALLQNPHVTITEVALQSGFSSLSTFNRIFKKQKNCTPTEYRSLYTALSR